MNKLLFLVLPVAILVSGCAHVISPQSLALADRSITFSMLQENPDAYRGKYVLLGGTVAEMTQTGEGIQLEVKQYDLDSRETPDITAGPGGRFLALTSVSPDATACKPGALVSMVGEVRGKKVQPLKGEDYTYPLIAIKELKIIPPPDENTFRTWVPYGP
jgi:outer membrane lipoprotein